MGKRFDGGLELEVVRVYLIDLEECELVIRDWNVTAVVSGEALSHNWLLSAT